MLRRALRRFRRSDIVKVDIHRGRRARWSGKESVVVLGTTAQHMDSVWRRAVWPPFLHIHGGGDLFADKEHHIRIPSQSAPLKSCTNRSMLYVQSTGPHPAQNLSPNDTLIECALSLSTIGQQNPSRLQAIIPYMGYGRGDWMELGSTTPLSAAVAVNIIAQASPHIGDVVVFDAHSAQIALAFQNTHTHFHDIPAGLLTLGPLMKLHKQIETAGMCVLAPDAGAAKRARRFREYLQLAADSGDQNHDASVGFGVCSKVRTKANAVDSVAVHVETGDSSLEGRHVVVVDDMIDTAGTLCALVDTLVREHKPAHVTCVATHGLFSGAAIERISDCDGINHVLTLDTIPHGPAVPESRRIGGFESSDDCGEWWCMSAGPLLSDTAPAPSNDNERPSLSFLHRSQSYDLYRMPGSAGKVHMVCSSPLIEDIVKFTEEERSLSEIFDRTVDEFEEIYR